MSTSCLASLAGMLCQFRQYGSSSFCDSWEWKLDPYSVYDRHQPVDLYIENADVAIDEETALYEQQDGFFLRRISRTKEGGTLWQYLRKKNLNVLLSYHVSADWKRITLLKDHSSSCGQMAFEYLAHLLTACMLAHGLLTFHGVLMEYEGNGIIISAASGTGKTTHVRLWRDLRRALIINGDRAVCAKTAEGWTGYGLPWSGTSGEQINRSVAIRALVVLRRGETNEARRISALEAFHQVFAHVLYPSWDKALAEKMMDLLESFLRDVPIFLLSCRPDAESVDVLHAALAEVLHE